MSRGHGKTEVGQLVLTSATPPGNIGMYAMDDRTIGVVGRLACVDQATRAVSSVVTATTDPITGRGVFQGTFCSWDEVFVIGGQSNADGRGVMDSSASPQSPNVLMIDKGENIKIAVEPLGEQVAGWINNIPSGASAGIPAHSFGLMMGKAIAQITGVRPMLVPCAIGSTSFAMWEIPADPLDRTTLFGAMNYRSHRVKVADRQPVFCWSGHETGISEASETMATGQLGYLYYVRLAKLFSSIRTYYPDAPIIYAQLSTTNDGSGATAQRKAGNQQRLIESDGTGDTPTLVAGSLAITALGVNATNTIAISGSSVTMIGDGGTSLGFTVNTPATVSGKIYALKMTVTGDGRYKVTDATGNDYIAALSAENERTIIFNAATNLFRIYRYAAAEPTNLVFTIISIHEMTTFQTDNTYMVVTHDVPRNAGADNQHISTEGNKEIGRRFALAYAERVLKLPGVDGTGPRLVSVTSTDATHTKVKFTQDLAAAKSGETNYSDGTNSLLRVYDDGTEKSVSSVAIDGADSTALTITHASCSGVRCVTYGDRPGQDAAWRKGVIYNTLDLPLPAPMFGPVVTP